MKNTQSNKEKISIYTDFFFITSSNIDKKNIVYGKSITCY